ncbi:MAG: DUF3035 domain-containing protein [Kiloniellales bacterium]
MHRPIITGVLALGVALWLPGCTGVREAVGLTKRQGPDEFMVTSRRQPLALPPDYSLRPPQPGAPARLDEQTGQEARRVVFGEAASVAARPDTSIPGFKRMSDGEIGLLRQAGALGVDPNIRHIIERETAEVVTASRTIIDEILFWRKPERPEKLVDAGAEAERLRKNVEAGKAPTEGETPTIKRKRRGLFDGLIN